jgi:D-beta-D-heptose 7-phosphate kinase/D-beta-D-heptose 1-phosphate adenosyltransferase
MIDRYTMGKVERVSPEAPVLVLHAHEEKDLPGGAGNVAVNLKAYQCTVSVLGRIGNDVYGEILKKMLLSMNVNPAGLLIQKDYKTIVKNRLISDSQQLLRVDFEKIEAISSELEKEALVYFSSIIQQIDVVAISDYAKGFLSKELLQKIIEIANQHEVPVIVDPKGVDFTKYRGATLIKPNRKEAYEAANLPRNRPIEEVAEKLYHMGICDQLIITRSEEGITLQNKLGSTHFPVSSKSVRDVTGAGDTVLATLALGIGNKIEPSLLIPLANVAAGIAVEHVGCMSIPLHLLAKRILEVEVESKVLDHAHLHVIQETLRGSPHLLIFLNEPEEALLSIFQALQQIATDNAPHHLMIYPERTYSLPFLSFLSSIPSISFILPPLEPKELSLLSEEVKVYFSLASGVIKRIYPTPNPFFLDAKVLLQKQMV